MEKYVVIHGHFYQPPRENPWLGEIERQPSAAPAHDWNRRIAEECYRPNGASRLVGSYARVMKIRNNFARLSFNFGSTLLHWLERHESATYRRIVEGDRESRYANHGHGNAIAQPFLHLILPLASRRDQVTEVRWGIRDFERHFVRRPEGMWLPETAVSRETLLVLQEEGIRFTVLSPSQAQRVRKLSPDGTTPGAWCDTPAGAVDPSQPYRCFLGDRSRFLDIFFYDGPISRAIAFEGLLNSGDDLVRRIQGAFSPARPHPQVVNLATDGESYGHHHRFGDMALGYAFELLERDPDLRLTNYGAFLELHPPREEVEIHEHSAWSCSHGLGRWSEDCGCRTTPGWHQQWRKPLRTALSTLQETLIQAFENQGKKLLAHPWVARDHYLTLLADRSPEARRRFLETHQARPLSPDEAAAALKLLEMAYCGQLMMTSCGWFFDELSGTETVQNLQYASRAMELARETGLPDPEPAFLDLLEQAPSNLPAYGNGRGVYQKRVRPAARDIGMLARYHALSALFDDPPSLFRKYGHTLENLSAERLASGPFTLALGRLRITSDLTGEQEVAHYAALHLGNHEFHAAIKAGFDPPGYDRIRANLTTAFQHGPIADTLRLLDQHFGRQCCDLAGMPEDERRDLMDRVGRRIMGDLGGAYRKIYEDNRKLMLELKKWDLTPPRGFLVAAEYTLAEELEGIFEVPDAGLASRHPTLVHLLEEAKQWHLVLAVPRFSSHLQEAITKKVRAISSAITGGQLEELHRLLDLSDLGTVPLDLFEIQNILYQTMTQGGLTLEGDRSRLRPLWDKLLQRLHFMVEHFAAAVPG